MIFANSSAVGRLIDTPNMLNMCCLSSMGFFSTKSLVDVMMMLLSESDELVFLSKKLY